MNDTVESDHFPETDDTSAVMSASSYTHVTSQRYIPASG